MEDFDTKTADAAESDTQENCAESRFQFRGLARNILRKFVLFSLVWTRNIRFSMARLSNLKALALRDPLAALKRRNPNYFNRYAGGDDAFGYKIETYARWEPFFRFCFEDYFKVDCRGIDNIPADGPALLVGNHSGLLPIDGAMIAIALCNQHQSQRRIRYMITDWFFYSSRYQ